MVRHAKHSKSTYFLSLELACVSVHSEQSLVDSDCNNFGKQKRTKHMHTSVHKTFPPLNLFSSDSSQRARPPRQAATTQENLPTTILKSFRLVCQVAAL